MSNRRERVDYNILPRSDEQSSGSLQSVSLQSGSSQSGSSQSGSSQSGSSQSGSSQSGSSQSGSSQSGSSPISSVSQIQDISQWLQDNGCDISQYMDTVSIKILKNTEKSSASDSIIIFGDMKINNNYNKVAFKIVFPSLLPIYSNSLDVEQQIYKIVTQKMINNFHSPHLTSCIGVVKLCDTEKFEAMLSEEQRKIFNTNKNVIDKNEYDLTKANILILSRSSGETLFDYLTRIQISVFSKFNMLFQILYTLSCFERVGLSHNDLHPGNIFVDEIQETHERIYYISHDKWVKTNIKYDTKIFDFDRSSIRHPSVDRNFTLDNQYCKNYDQCNKYSSRRDLSSILLIFYKYAGSNDSIQKFIESLAVGGKDGPFLKRGITRNFPQLNTFRNNTGEYTQDPEIDENQLPSITECIDKLLNFKMKFSNDKTYNSFEFSTGSGRTNGTIYTLPEPVVETYWTPSTTIQHASLQLAVKPHNMTSEDLDKYISSIYVSRVNTTIKPDNIYEKEFGKNYFEENTKKLFRLYIDKKPIVNHKYLIVSCYLLCLPFLYKFTERDILIFLITSDNIMADKNKESRRFFINQCLYFIDDIWNLFDNTLPISMIKM
jgi:hypothetical protein